MRLAEPPHLGEPHCPHSTAGASVSAAVPASAVVVAVAAAAQLGHLRCLLQVWQAVHNCHQNGVLV